MEQQGSDAGRKTILYWDPVEKTIYPIYVKTASSSQANFGNWEHESQAIEVDDDSQTQTLQEVIEEAEIFTPVVTIDSTAFQPS